MERASLAGRRALSGWKAAVPATGMRLSARNERIGHGVRGLSAWEEEGRSGGMPASDSRWAFRQRGSWFSEGAIDGPMEKESIFDWCRGWNR